MSENESVPAETAPISESVEQVVKEEVVAEPVAAEPVATEPVAPAEPIAPTKPAAPTGPPVPPEEITYHAVEKDGQVTAIWEMQGRRHLRTIDPRSRQGQDILRLYTADHHDETPALESSDAASI